VERLQFDLNLLSRESPAAPLDQPDARRTNQHSSAHDSVQLHVREQKHALDEVVVSSAGAAEDEAEDRPEHHEDGSHHRPASGKTTR
jgi:hypothetical protein